MKADTNRSGGRLHSHTRLLQTAGWSAMLLALSTPAWAQDQLHAPPPSHFSLDERGVDLIAGTFNVSSTDVVIGQPGAGGLAYQRTFVGPGWRDNITGTIAASGSTFTVSIGPVSDVFTQSGTSYVPVTNTGSTLTYNSGTSAFTYVGPDGTIYAFNAPGDDIYSPTQNDAGYIQSITKPNGEVITYGYRGVTVPTGNPNDPYVPAFRVARVTSNHGYELVLEYVRDTATSVAALPNFYRIKKVTGYNMAVDYCASGSFTCSFSRTWPSASYSSGDVTDQSGRTTSYTFNSNKIASIKPPGAAAPTTVIAYDPATGRVSTVTAGSDVWTYGYADSGSTRTTTVSDPLSKVSTATSDLSTSRLSSWRDPLLRETSYQYDGQKRLTRVTRPEGDYVSYTLDTRGNTTQARAVAKPLTGLPDIVASSAYSASCTNPATCNLPTSTTDALGGVTDYTYDSVHGGVLTITQPAPTVGANRPQTRTSYAAKTAYIKNSSGSIVPVASSVTLPVSVSACATGSTCTGTAQEVKSTVVYGATGVANNLLPTSTTSGNGAGTLSATTTLTYTPNGDVASVDGPLSGTTDTTTYRYDDARQLVGVISPDPDGGGPLLRRAVRNTYDPRGQVTLAEQGTVTGLTDPNWAAFVSLQQQATAYDALGRPTHQRAQAGGTTHALTQVSYDAAGRTDCVVTRMNPLTFAAPPNSACTATGVGIYGPDRVARYGYDAASQLTSTTAGYGSGSPITESATYTNNGQPQTLTDGRGNVSTFEYDGHDRLKKLRYPNPSSSGSSTTDYEEYGYDVASNVISTRTRANQTFTATYDALNRQTALVAPAGTDGVEYAYDNLGRMTSATITGTSNTTTRLWDALNRLTSETGPLGTMAYQYDLAGRRTRQTWPDAFYVTNNWNLVNEMTATLHSGTTQIIGYSYDNLGRRAGITRGNGVTSTYGYDGVSRLTSLSHDVGGTDADVTFGYGYNPAGQIITKAVSNNAYVYGPGTGSTAYANNGLNQVTNVGGSGVGYDANGNITNDTTRPFTYDAANRLTGANGGTSTLSYDALGRLDVYVGTYGGRHIYDGAETVGFAPVGSTSLQNRFIRGPGVDEIVANYTATGPVPAQYWAADERGSLVNLSGSTGANTIVNTYDEYGVPAPTNLGRLQYTGQLWMPDFGAYHYKARAYQPGLGRFLQADPLGYQAGANLYAYVAGDPINASDPFGLRKTYKNDAECSLAGGTPSDAIDEESGLRSCIFQGPTSYIGGGATGNGSGIGGGPSAQSQEQCSSRSPPHDLGRRAPGLRDGYWGVTRGVSAVPGGGSELKWTNWRHIENGIVTEAFETRTLSGLAGVQIGVGAGLSYSNSDPRGKSFVFQLSFGVLSGAVQYSKDSGWGYETTLGAGLSPEGIGGGVGGQSSTVTGCAFTSTP